MLLVRKQSNRMLDRDKKGFLSLDAPGEVLITSHTRHCSLPNEAQCPSAWLALSVTPVRPKVFSLKPFCTGWGPLDLFVPAQG